MGSLLMPEVWYACSRCGWKKPRERTRVVTLDGIRRRLCLNCYGDLMTSGTLATGEKVQFAGCKCQRSVQRPGPGKGEDWDVRRSHERSAF